MIAKTLQPPAAGIHPDVRLFEAHRGLLFSIAYRMLGSATDAEDVVQDAWLRYAGAPPRVLRSTRAWLGTIVTRLCLDRLKASRTTREQYVGPWLPEPVLHGDREPSLARAVERGESITLAFLVLLESLTPQERAVFLLREVFDFEYRDIAEMLELTPANCRQLFHRAKARLAQHRPRLARHGAPSLSAPPVPPSSSSASSSSPSSTPLSPPLLPLSSAAQGGRRYRPSRARHQQLVRAFIEAASHGDLDGLRALLAEDVIFRADGGGKVAAAMRPVHGRDAVARMLVGLKRKLDLPADAGGLAPTGWVMSIATINGAPAILVLVDGTIDSVVSLATTGDDIWAIDLLRNPEKLAYVRDQLKGALTRTRPFPLAPGKGAEGEG